MTDTRIPDPWHEQLGEGQTVIEVDSHESESEGHHYTSWDRTVVTVRDEEISIGRQYLYNWPDMQDADDKWHFWPDVGIWFKRDAVAKLEKAMRQKGWVKVAPVCELQPGCALEELHHPPCRDYKGNPCG